VFSFERGGFVEFLRDMPQEPNDPQTDAGMSASNPGAGSRQFLLDEAACVS
jgi:hypothetical protein